MQPRWLGWTLAALALIVVVLVVRSCGSGGTRGADDAELAAQPAATVDAQPAPSAADAAATAAAREVARQRDDAMYAAVGTVQRYLAALGGDDRAKADAFWADGRPPAASGEADLRTLTGLRGLRIENGTPKPLDGDAVPSALEVPVSLRAGIAAGGVQRYTGWYRVRRTVSGDAWQITSASVTRDPPVQ